MIALTEGLSKLHVEKIWAVLGKDCGKKWGVVSDWHLLGVLKCWNARVSCTNDMFLGSKGYEIELERESQFMWPEFKLPISIIRLVSTNSDGNIEMSEFTVDINWWVYVTIICRPGFQWNVSPGGGVGWMGCILFTITTTLFTTLPSLWPFPKSLQPAIDGSASFNLACPTFLWLQWHLVTHGYETHGYFYGVEDFDVIGLTWWHDVADYLCGLPHFFDLRMVETGLNIAIGKLMGNSLEEMWVL